MQSENKSLVIGIVGADHRVAALLSAVLSMRLADLFPDVLIAGLADLEPDPKVIRLARRLKIPTYTSHVALLAGQPEVNLVALFQDDPALLALLRRNLPVHISLLDHFSASFLWDLIVEERFCLSCRTDLQTAQSMLKTIVDEVREDILLLDTDKSILDVNENVCKRLGRSKQDIVGRPCWTTWQIGGSGCGSPDMQCPYETVLETGRKAEAVHSRIDADGLLHYFRIYVYPIFDKDGAIVQFVEMRRDITRRTDMEKRLQQSEKMAAIGELSTYIAHEIRNPLFAIGGFAHTLLKSGRLEDRDMDKIRIIMEEAQRLDRILTSILGFARPVQGEAMAVDVNAILDDVLSLMRIGCEKQGICLTVELTQGLPRVHGDAEQIKQCLINVVKNGIESMPDGGELVVRTGIEHNFVAVEVEDTGAGIPKGNLEMIFNPFFSTKKKGSGLGLAMTKKLIEGLGGSVAVLSQEGKGTTVVLLMPPVLALE
jgi:PAS domain S-box-containing protein